jgi:hypothetical protein
MHQHPLESLREGAEPADQGQRIGVTGLRTGSDVVATTGDLEEIE